MPARTYGWIPDLPDHRDQKYAAPSKVLKKLPSCVDLRAQCPAVYDQGDLGSCTANAIGAAMEFDEMKQNLPHVIRPSRLFIYYNERVIEHTVAYDAGAQIRDGIKCVVRQGACDEQLWGYDIAKFRDKPSQPCYDDGLQHQAVLYQRLSRNLRQMKGCLASGFPFVFGFTVYESFESEEVAQSGQAPMPSPQERSVGGHAVLAAGYDDGTQRFLVRNSWGTDWGMEGYFTLPYDYLMNSDLSDDLWTIRLVE